MKSSSSRASKRTHIDKNHRATLKVMNFDIWAQIPPQDAKGSQTSHQTHLKVSEWNFIFFRQGGPHEIFLFPWSPLLKKHKISLSYFQMCLMARLKALGILRWNLGSDIKIHDLRSSAMVLIDVRPLVHSSKTFIEYEITEICPNLDSILKSTDSSNNLQIIWLKAHRKRAPNSKLVLCDPITSNTR